MTRKLILLFVLLSVTLGAKETCGPNERFMECGTACEPKCNQPFPKRCTFNCIVNVCQCKPGFKRGPKGCVAPGPGCT